MTLWEGRYRRCAWCTATPVLLKLSSPLPSRGWGGRNASLQERWGGARPRCRVGGKEWEVMSERDTCIYSQSQLALFEQKQPQIIIVLCSVGKKINVSFFLWMELLIDENDFRRYSVPCVPEEEVKLSRGALQRPWEWGHCQTTKVLVIPPPPVSLFCLSVYVYVLYLKEEKKKFYTTDWLIYFYCTRMKRMLEDTTFKKNKLVLVLSKCFLGVCGRVILYLGWLLSGPKQPEPTYAHTHTHMHTWTQRHTCVSRPGRRPGFITAQIFT